MGWLQRLLCWCLTGSRKAVRQQLTPAGNPLPSTVHKVLHPADLGPGRLIIVGDVHGCYDTLVALLQKVEYRPRHDNLILVGDLVNKGPKSQQVVAAARAWCEGSYCWVVRGNHDDAALEARAYLAAGGLLSGLAPKFSWVHELLPEDVEFLTELPFSVRVEGYNVLVVHAALLPGVPLEAQDLGVLTKVRDLLHTPDGRWIGLEQPEEDSQAWAECWQGPGHVFFGHDAKRNLQEAPCATGLDTGCVYGRQLTACVLPPLAILRGQPLQQDAVKHADHAAHDHQQQQQGSRNQPGSDPNLVQGAWGQGSGAAASRGGWSQGVGASCTVELGPTPSRQELQAELHSVPSTFLFDKKAEKQEKKLLKRQRKGK